MLHMLLERSFDMKPFLLTVTVEVVLLVFFYNYVSDNSYNDDFGSGILFYLTACLFAVTDFVWFVVLLWRSNL